MLNKRTRGVLISTSFAPLLFVIAMNVFDCKTLWFWGLCIGGIILVFLCWGLMKKESNKPVTDRWHVKEFRRKDEGIHMFLVIYILPIIRSPDSLLNADWQTIVSAIAVIGLIITVMVKMGAFYFNPILSILGYNFYEVKDRDDVHHLLITRQRLVRHSIEVRTRRISQNVFVEVEDSNAEHSSYHGNCRSKKRMGIARILTR